MVRNKVIFLLIISLFIFLSFPNKSKAEIATATDWIGLFPTTDTTYTKSNTLTCSGTTDGHCWAYTSSAISTCSQTAGTTPRLFRNSTDTCTFTLNPIPPTNKSYVFRLMANDTGSADAVIASKPLSYGISPNPVPINGKLYYIAKNLTTNGNLTIDSNITVIETGIIFVEGNLYINSNLTHNNPKKGLVFVVKGGIYINKTVTEVDAYLISHGKDANGANILPFCSAWDGTLNPTDSNCLDYVDNTARNYLVINGAVISLNAAIDPKFARAKYSISGTNPAETVNFEAKYLVIMKDLFSRDLKIWREIQ